MSRSAAKAVMPLTGLDKRASTAELLSDGAFQARLAKARDDRQKVLAELGGDEAPLRRQKPWERRTAARPVSPQTGVTPDGPLILTEQERLPGALPVAIAGGSRLAPAQPPTAPDTLGPGMDSHMRQRGGSLLIVVGFLAGILIGAGAMWLFSVSSPPRAADATDDLSGSAIADTDVVGVQVVASPAVPESAVAGSPAAQEQSPLVFADGPTPFLVPTVAGTVPAMPSASDGDVVFAPSVVMALLQPEGLDLPLQSQTPPWGASPGVVSQTIFLHAPTGVAESAVAEALDALDRAGFTIADTRRVGLSISRSNARYFHPEDVAAATRLAGEIGAVARDFTAYRPSPPVGTIEVWLAGRSAVTRRSAPSPQRAERDEQLLFLRRLIIEKLRGSGNLSP